jgi:hypothetical protein
MLQKVVQDQEPDSGMVALIIGDEKTSDPMGFISTGPFGPSSLAGSACPCDICVDINLNVYHVVKFPVPTTEIEKDTLRAAQESRVSEINLRNIQRSIQQRAHKSCILFELPTDIQNPKLILTVSGLHEGIWETNKVQRVASVAIGQKSQALRRAPEEAKTLDITDIARAVEVILNVDGESREMQNDDVVQESNKAAALSPTIRNSCTTYEMKLLSGLIEPGVSSCLHLLIK